MGGIFLDHGGERGTVGYPGLTRAEIAARFPTSIPSAEVGEDGWWDAGKETDQQAQHRAIGVAADLRARAGEKTRIGFVTHGGFMSLLLSALGNQARDNGSYYEHENTADYPASRSRPAAPRLSDISTAPSTCPTSCSDCGIQVCKRAHRNGSRRPDK